MKDETGLIHIYCGDGKGKTTAAVGLAVRCAGGGGKVFFYQFLKDGTSGEIDILKNIDEITVGKGYALAKFSFQMTDEEKENARIFYEKELDEIISIVSNQEYQLCVLDEILHAVNLGFVSLDKLVGFLKNKPEKLEVVLTGRNPKEELCELADYITEMNKIKHPFDKGISARTMIEK